MTDSEYFFNIKLLKRYEIISIFLSFDRSIIIYIYIPSNIISSLENSNERILPVLWQMFARQRSVRRGGGRNDWNSINSGRARAMKWFPFFATLFFFVLNRWKRKESSQVEEDESEGGGSIFRYPSMNSYVLVLEALHPPIGPSSLRSVGETDRWVDTSSRIL